MPTTRYFYSGDGKISIASKGGASFSGVYRKADGSYNEAALKAINRVFGANFNDPLTRIDTRLIEFLNYLENKLNPGARITISSGFRSPEYNTKLREKGKLAAKASLHQYGMAADLKINGVPSNHVWNYVKDLKFGGAGFYHGALVHIDVGPARFWDEETSGVGTDISEENKLVALVTDKDIYLSGENIFLRFIRMTAYPIGVAPEFTLEELKQNGDWKKIKTVKPTFNSDSSDSCPQFDSVRQLLEIKFPLAKNIPAGHFRIRATFCNKLWDAMPNEITTPEFEVR